MATQVLYRKQEIDAKAKKNLCALSPSSINDMMSYVCVPPAAGSGQSEQAPPTNWAVPFLASTSYPCSRPSI